MDVDLSDENIWLGYDEKANYPVSIDEFKGQFDRV